MACLRLSTALLGRHRSGTDARRLSSRNIAALPPAGHAGGKLEPPPDAVHLFAEAGRLAFADRGLYVADSDFVKVNVAGLLDPAYLKQRAQLIGDRSMGTAKPGVPPGNRPQPPKTHLRIRKRHRTSRWSTASATRCQ